MRRNYSSTYQANDGVFLMLFNLQEDEIAKFLHKKKTLLLHKLEDGEHDWLKTEKTRSNMEELQCRIFSLQESINGTCMSISKLRDEELHPQLVELSSG